MTPTIHSLRVDAVEGGYHIHGCTSLGPVSRVGATEQEAMALAKIQLREYVRQYSALAYVECVERKPEYFQRKTA